MPPPAKRAKTTAAAISEPTAAEDTCCAKCDRTFPPTLTGYDNQQAFCVTCMHTHVERDTGRLVCVACAVADEVVCPTCAKSYCAPNGAPLETALRMQRIFNEHFTGGRWVSDAKDKVVEAVTKDAGEDTEDARARVARMRADFLLHMAGENIPWSQLNSLLGHFWRGTNKSVFGGFKFDLNLNDETKFEDPNGNVRTVPTVSLESDQIKFNVIKVETTGLGRYDVVVLKSTKEWVDGPQRIRLVQRWKLKRTAPTPADGKFALARALARPLPTNVSAADWPVENMECGMGRFTLKLRGKQDEDIIGLWDDDARSPKVVDVGGMPCMEWTTLVSRFTELGTVVRVCVPPRVQALMLLGV